MARRKLMICAALALGATVHGADVPRPAFNQVVTSRIQPQVEKFVQQLVREGRAMRIDGTPVFNGSDKFLPGKIALAFSDVIAALPAGDARLAATLADFRRVATLTVDDPNDSWGIYYYLSALASLNRADQLREALDPLTLAKLRVRLDWRTFVDRERFTLIDHPNNYYCVAFAIARLRHALGWEDGEGARRLYAEMTAHYREYAGTSGFADETDGEGRFDRYSILLAAEIAQRFVETGETPPAEILEWVRKSAEVMAMRMNTRGEGFEYGRSLGPYADTSMVEVFAAAAVLGLLDDEQKETAYAYSSRVAERYADLWIDARTGSVNLWDGGRRTDAYRGKFRILGENFSLGHQFIYTNAAWNRIGFRDKPPARDLAARLERLPKRLVTWFARGEHDRLLLSMRDRAQVVGLPLINGGATQHMHVPYYPIPFSPGMLDGIADGDEPMLLPRFELDDGAVLMPLAWFREVAVTGNGSRTRVTYHQTEMDKMGERKPVRDGRLTVSTIYEFGPGVITRTDTYTAKQPLTIRNVRLAFGSHSTAPATRGTATRFGSGQVREFAVSGLDTCESGSALDDAEYHTNAGPLQSKVVCSRSAFTLSEPLTIRWTLRYEARPQ